MCVNERARVCVRERELGCVCVCERFETCASGWPPDPRQARSGAAASPSRRHPKPATSRYLKSIVVGIMVQIKNAAVQTEFYRRGDLAASPSRPHPKPAICRYVKSIGVGIMVHI